MKRSAAILWTPAIGLSLGAAAWSADRALEARAEAARAGTALAALAADARELAVLRSQAPGETDAPRPASELPARLTAVLGACGLPASAVQNFSAEASRRDPQVQGAQRERASLVLGQVTLPQVGRFLGAWRDAEPEWVVSAIELTPGGGGAAPGGGELPLRVLMSLDAVTAEPHAGGRP